VVQNAGYDVHAALRLLPQGNDAARTADEITGHATPFLAFLEKWKPDAGLPIEQIEAKDVQQWIDTLIAASAEHGLSAKTVDRKMAEIRNCWGWLQSLSIVPEDRNPFCRTSPTLPVAARRRTNFVNAIVPRTWCAVGRLRNRTDGG
jgi:hypothetical protein